MGGLENRNGTRLKSIAVFLYQVLFGMALLSFFNCKGFGVAGNALAVSVQEFLVVPMLLASGKGEACRNRTSPTLKIQEMKSATGGSCE